MVLPVDLQSVVDEMDVISDEWIAYINRETGDLFSFSDDELLIHESNEDGETDNDWRAETIAKAQEVLESEYFIELPGRFEIDEYSIMQRYCHGVAGSRVQEALIQAIKGSGAFGRFKDLIHREGIAEDWYTFRDTALRKIAADFLEAEEIPYVDDKSRD
jgi:hypothetical protein